MITRVDDNLLDPANVADPYPVLAQLLTEGPVRWSDTHDAWMVLSHASLIQALRDESLSSDRVMPVFETQLSPEARQRRAPTFEILRHWMVFNDPPNHTRLRALVSRAFTPGSIERLKPRIEQIVANTLDDLQDRDTVDLIRDFAFPVPAIVIAELLGVPIADRDLFKEWSNCIMTLVFGGSTTADRRERGQDGLLELGAYLRSRIADARSGCADNLLGTLATAQHGDDTLTEDEIVATCTLLLFAGHETTTNLIGNGTRALLEHPPELARFRTDPSVTRSAIEEILRFDGPSKVEVRRVARPVSLGGCQMQEGQQVLLLQAAANRDPDQFDNPTLFDITRYPNRHVGFGFGPHHCLGASLARLEGTIALRRLFERFPALAPASPDPTWHPVLISRGMSSYRVSLGSPR